jgi:ATP adenylyltransferase
MTLDALLQFLRGDIKMSHYIYQPVLIRTLLDNGGSCTRRQLALALLMQDESQIDYYDLREMPLPVLKKRGVISEMNGVVRLEVDKLSLQERASIRL